MWPRKLGSATRFVAFLMLVAVCSWAQFSGSIQGTVKDPASAVVPNAKIQLKNTQTNITSTTTSDNEGNFRFVSLAPGSYQMTVDATGFGTTTLPFALSTDQNLNLPVALKLASAAQTVEVTGVAPILNTAESRNQVTLSTRAIDDLPLAGRNMISLVTMAPGVIGIGTVAAGSPGSGVDNFSTETQVDASGNGAGSVGNMFMVDGLDVTSAIRPGVLNLTPNPDSVQEASIQTNTFSVEYGRASSVQMSMTTKSGTDGFHGTASEYFTNQKLFAGTEFLHNYSPYHSNNMSATIGGPIIPHHQFFFFFAIEPLRASTSTGNSVQTYEDPAFTAFANANFPNTLGTKILTTYAATNATTTGISQTANTAFAGTCGTPATFNLPCSTPVLDSGVFNGTNYRNGTQFNVRIDKYFNKDRIYGNVYRSVLDTGGPAIRPAFAATNHFILNSWQFNETHSFSPTMVNEASFGYMRDEGIQPQTGLFSVPLINVTGSLGFGNGFAARDFIQHNYHWRDVLTNIRGSHILKAGYEGWFGDDVENFQGPHSQPTFNFNNLLDLAQDKPFTETGVAYNPIMMEKAGLKMPEKPTWDFIRQAADKMTDKAGGVYGVCLRGKPGWGENMAFLTAMSNSFGARWFDEKWEPQFNYARMEGDDRLLRPALEGRRTARRLVERLQREPRPVQRRQVRHVDRRHGRGWIRNRSEAIQGRRQGRLRARAEQRPRQERQLAMGVVARRPGGHEQGGRRGEVRFLGDQQALHRSRRLEGRLGSRSARNPHLALQECRLYEGGSVGRDDARVDQFGRPAPSDREAGSVHGRAVRRDPRVPGYGDGRWPGLLGGSRGNDDRRPGAREGPGQRETAMKKAGYIK